MAFPLIFLHCEVLQSSPLLLAEFSSLSLVGGGRKASLGSLFGGARS